MFSRLIAFRLALVSMLATGLMSAPFAATPTEAAVTTNVKVPVAIGVFVPCANGGAGEFVLLTGDLHILFTLEADGAGGFHGSFHFQPQGISGTGAVTGAKYQGTGVTRGSFNVKPPFPANSPFVNNFYIIGQGRGNNFKVHVNSNFVVDANGNVTATPLNTSITCG